MFKLIPPSLAESVSTPVTFFSWLNPFNFKLWLRIREEEQNLTQVFLDNVYWESIFSRYFADIYVYTAKQENTLPRAKIAKDWHQRKESYLLQWRQDANQALLQIIIK